MNTATGATDETPVRVRRRVTAPPRGGCNVRAAVTGCTPRHKPHRKTARAVVWMVVVLAGLEAAVRVRAVARYGWHTALADWTVRTDDGAVRPGVTRLPGGQRTTINRWGLRGHDIALHKPPGVFRILCLGESTTFGQPGDDDAVIWPARLQRRLRDAGHRVEVINGASPGWTVARSMQALDRLMRFSPDVVIIYHGATDLAAHCKRQFANAKAADGAGATLARWRDRLSMGYMLLRRNTAGWLATQYQRHRNHRLDARGINRFATQLEQLVRACRAGGAGVLLCSFPRAFGRSQPAGEQAQWAETALFFNPQLDVAGLSDAYARYNEAIRGVARRTGVRLVDLDRMIDVGGESFVDSVHLSASGHDQVAARIVPAVDEWIRSRALAGVIQ